jgi:MurNAc alpha-1-phosphate uridylyltransferase
MLKIVILAGGLAQRLRPMTEKIPKSLVSVNGKFFVDWQLELLSKKGVTEVIFCLSYKSKLIQKHVGDGSRYNLKINYSYDGDVQLGTGGAIQNALPYLDEKFMVLYGDSYLDIDYLKAEKAFNLCGKPSMMTVFKNNNLRDKSNVEMQHSNIIRYCKKDVNSKFQYIDFGLSFFKREVFINNKYGNKFDLSDLQSDLSLQGKLAGYEVFERFYEIGSFRGIDEFSKFLSSRRKNVVYKTTP